MKESEKVKKLTEERIYFKKLARAMMDELYSRERNRISKEIYEKFGDRFDCGDSPELARVIYNIKK